MTNYNFIINSLIIKMLDQGRCIPRNASGQIRFDINIPFIRNDKLYIFFKFNSEMFVVG
jgi:hypothetical protein